MIGPWRLIRRAVVLTVGSIVVLIGIIMFFTPGPAVVVIPIGLAILATEFAWAKQLLVRFKEEAEKGAAEAGGYWKRWQAERRASKEQRGPKP